MLTIKIKYLVPDLTPVVKTDIGDWIDLRAAQDVTLKQGELADIPLGVAMQLPKGYEAWLSGRSSLAKKFGVVHADDLGIIDESYCGDNDEWKFPVLALRDTVIHKNDRICQFRIAEKMKPIHLDFVPVLGNPDRGGLGSTGIK